jgi:hypothetical protein
VSSKNVTDAPPPAVALQESVVENSETDPKLTPEFAVNNKWSVVAKLSLIETTTGIARSVVEIALRSASAE